MVGNRDVVASCPNWQNRASRGIGFLAIERMPMVARCRRSFGLGAGRYRVGRSAARRGGSLSPGLNKRASLWTDLFHSR